MSTSATVTGTPAGTVRIAVAMACYNRVATTLRCLELLLRQQSNSLQIGVFLVDDASPDGTGAIVRQRYPEVQVLTGSGSLFWGGGMRLAIQAAMSTDWDYLLWLNDDVELGDDSLDWLVEWAGEARASNGSADHIIVGALSDPDGQRVTYSGYGRIGRWNPVRLKRLDPDDRTLTECDTMNGNCVLIPRPVLDRIGSIDPHYVQQIGDVEYGHRAKAAGVRIWLGPRFVGSCAENTRPKPWQSPGLGFRRRWALMQTPHGIPWRPWLRFMWRYGGVPGTIALAKTYAKWLLPDLVPFARRRN